MKKNLLTGLIFTAALTAGSLAFAANASKATVGTTPTFAPKSQIFSAAQTAAIQNILHDYIVQNPQILVEASQALRYQEMQKMQTDTKNQIANYAKDLQDVSKRFAIGNPKGDIVMVDIFDYQCPHCKVMNQVAESLVKDDPNLQVIFMEWPIFGPDSVYAAKAAYAAFKEGKYLAMHDALFAVDAPLSQDKVLAIAKSIGLNEKQFSEDLQSSTVDQALRANVDLAQNLKLQATPAFILIKRSSGKSDLVLGEVSKDELTKAIAGVRK